MLILYILETMDGFLNKEDIAAELMVIERPKNWMHLIKTLLTVDEYKLLRL
jgi:hypothetical protein